MVVVNIGSRWSSANNENEIKMIKHINTMKFQNLTIKLIFLLSFFCVGANAQTVEENALEIKNKLELIQKVAENENQDA